MFDMNIQSQQQCLKEWEREYILTGDDSLIPEEDKERVLHEVNVLYAEMFDLLRSVGTKCLNLRVV